MSWPIALVLCTSFICTTIIITRATNRVTRTKSIGQILQEFEAEKDQEN